MASAMVTRAGESCAGAVVVVALEEECHPAEPHHADEVLLQRLATGVVAARHVLREVLGVAEQRPFFLGAALGPEALVLRHLVEDEVDVLRVGVFGQFGLRVEGLDAGGEVRHRLLAGLTEIFGVLRQLLAVDVGGKGLRQGHDVGVEFTLFDVLEGLVELDVIQVQKGVGGDEDRHLPVFHVLVGGDDVLVALAGDDGEAIGLQGRFIIG